jgi:hypothetical protein
MISRIAALTVAAIVATAVTTFLVICAGLVADLASGANANSGWGNLFGTMLFGVGWAVVLGFIGAFVAMAVGVTIFGRGQRTRSYVLAGVAAGLLHSLVGVALKLAVGQEGYAAGTNDVLGSIILWGGFILTNLPGWNVVAVTIPASMLAGALAGLVYARLIGARPDPRR